MHLADQIVLVEEVVGQLQQRGVRAVVVDQLGNHARVVRLPRRRPAWARPLRLDAQS